MANHRSARLKIITNEALKFDPSKPIPRDELLKIAIKYGKTNPFMNVDKTTLKKDIETVLIREDLT